MERITTWVSGDRSRICRVASMPFIYGIAMSATNTLGCSCETCRTASRPLAATPTTRMSSWTCSRCVRPSCMTGWSSAIKTVIGMRGPGREEAGRCNGATLTLFPRNLDTDARTLAGRGFHRQLGADRLRPLAHDCEPPARVRQGGVRHVETDAVVGDGERHPVRECGEQDLDALGLRVRDGIHKRSLRHAK